MTPLQRVAAAAMLSVAMLHAPLTLGAQGSCRCGDARDLFTRYCAAQGAIKEWNRLIHQFREDEKTSGKVINATDGTSKDDVATCVDEIINIHGQEGPGSRRARAITDRNCEITIKAAPNDCIRGVLMQHESWHKKVCEAHSRPDAPWRSTANPFNYLAGLISRFSQMSIIDFMYEERTGYMLEADYTRTRLEELASECDEPKVVRSTQQGRSLTLQPCPTPDLSTYNERQCKFK